MKDYSQSGEQKIILDYFGYKFSPVDGNCLVAPRVPGVFLSIGENDGETLSMVRALAMLGWSGTCVEPAEVAFKKLHALYNEETKLTLFRHDQKIQCVQAAITTTDGPLEFYSSGTHLKKGDTDLLSTTRPDELARWKRSGEVFTKTMVRGITFNTLLKETGLTRADFISIDCEGVDLDVLRQIDLTALGTRMVCVEVNQSPEAPFMEYLARHGFRKHHRNHENLIAVKA